MIPHEEESMVVNNAGGQVHGGAFEGYTESPFGIGRGEGVDKGRGEHEWVVEKEKYEYDDAFEKLNPVNGKITGAAAKSEMVKSKLPNSVLSKVSKNPRPHVHPTACNPLRVRSSFCRNDSCRNHRDTNLCRHAKGSSDQASYGHWVML